MNRTNFEHAGYALMMMAAVAWPFGWFAGAAFGIAFFLGREHAQAQRSLGLGDFEAFDVRRWSIDGQLDLLFPVLACTFVLAFLNGLGVRLN